MRHPPGKRYSFVRLCIHVEDAARVNFGSAFHRAIVRHANVEMTLYALDKGSGGRNSVVGRDDIGTAQVCERGREREEQMKCGLV